MKETMTKPARASIKIGVIAEAETIVGASILQAAQMAAAEINVQSGAAGRIIEIIETTAITAMFAKIKDIKPDVIITGMTRAGYIPSCSGRSKPVQSRCSE
jgi:glutamate racemase